MKYYTQFNTSAKHNYELVCVDDDMSETIVPLNRKTTDNFLYLPDTCVRDTNRRLISIAMIERSGDVRFEITPKEYREARTLTGMSKKGLEDWLEGDDKVLYLELVEKAKKAREEAMRPRTEVEKAMAQVEKWKRKLEELMAANAKEVK